ncbi:unnamed protein product [Brugia pahangi]|uniref:DUF4200 domain-containing protein n=1 Tax=Brugia pahangi TaxID=6280 RepID=A0A0N4T3R4_BRUPA|nr:unnamed protein product [Brugia pahangi]
MESENNKTNDGYDQSSSGVMLKKDPRICDSAKVPAAFSEGALVSIDRENLPQLLEVNKFLKEEMSLLNTRAHMLKKKLPPILNSEGNDFTDEFIRMKVEMDKEKARANKLEALWFSEEKKIIEERSKLKEEEDEWKEKIKMKEKLASKVNELHEQIFEKIVGDELNFIQHNLLVETDRYNTLRIDFETFEHIVQQTEQELSHQEKTFEDDLDQMQIMNAMALIERDRTICTLVNQLKWITKRSVRAQSENLTTVVHTGTQTVTEFETMFDDEI